MNKIKIKTTGNPKDVKITADVDNGTLVVQDGNDIVIIHDVDTVHIKQ